MSKLCIPEEALKQHLAVLGKTGAGKSSALRHIVEHLLDNGKRVCILDPKGDWSGLKTSGDGKSAGYPVIGFGDFKDTKGQDIPINEHSGKYVAELVATGNRPCIIGFRGWQTSKMVRFFIDFAPIIFSQNSGELYLIGDEFHNFAAKGKILDPQAGLCLHWANRLMSEGRGYGLVCMIASQRPQKVHNDTLTCCETLVAMRVIHAADRNAVKDWIEGCGDMKKGKEVLDNLAGMERGEAYVWSPEIGFGPTRLTFPMFKTFDSFAPPQLQKKISASGWADVDLSAVKEKMASVIEEAKANDPAELKRQIAELKRQIGRPQMVESPAKNEIKRVEIPVLKEGQLKRAEELAERLNTLASLIISEGAKPIADAVRLTNVPRPATIQQRAPQPAQHIPRTVHQPRPIPDRSPLLTGTPIPSNGETPTGGMRRMLTALADRSRGLTAKQIGVRAGLSMSGTFTTYMSTLRKNGWITGNGSGVNTITQEGLATLGDYEPLPTGTALLDYWLRKLGNSGAARMLQAVADRYPDSLSPQEIAEAANMQRSGTFTTYMSTLRKLELIEGKGSVKANKELFD